MSAIANLQQFVSVEEYLAGERHAETRHEYVGGQVYGMAGASDEHNRVVTNICGELRERLRGKRCEPFMADMKLKIPESQAFYYPDVLVACDPSDNDPYFRERPTAVFEVLSPETERTDKREKRFAYALVPSLRVYVIVAQDRWELTVLRRAKAAAWTEETVTGSNAILKLPELRLEIPLARIYERTKAARRAA